MALFHSLQFCRLFWISIFNCNFFIRCVTFKIKLKAIVEQYDFSLQLTASYGFYFFAWVVRMTFLFEMSTEEVL